MYIFRHKYIKYIYTSCIIYLCIKCILSTYVFYLRTYIYRSHTNAISS